MDTTLFLQNNSLDIQLTYSIELSISQSRLDTPYQKMRSYVADFILGAIKNRSVIGLGTMKDTALTQSCFLQKTNHLIAYARVSITIFSI